VPVMTQVWRNEVVLRYRTCGQISRQLVKGLDVRDTLSDDTRKPYVISDKRTKG
jgi:hypothetical protein